MLKQAIPTSTQLQSYGSIHMEFTNDLHNHTCRFDCIFISTIYPRFSTVHTLLGLPGGVKNSSPMCRIIAQL